MSPRASEPAWARASDAELLALPLRELGLERPGRGVRGPRLAPQIQTLHSELASAGLRLRPHVWLSTDWFSPDGVAGLALPFALAHPRLVRLERAQLTWAEGSTRAGCLALLRHEAGHAVDTAYGLSRLRLYRDTFGRRGAPYRRHYTVDPRAGGFVRHLDRWYAQSHPAEDFAETFAVWLGGRGRREARRVAPEKLAAVESLLAPWRGRTPRNLDRTRPHALATRSETLGAHYRARRRRVEREPAPPFERELLRRFLPGTPWNRSASGARALERDRARLARAAADALGPEISRYDCDQVLCWCVQRARELGLELRDGRAPFDRGLAIRIIQRTLDALAAGHPLAR